MQIAMMGHLNLILLNLWSVYLIHVFIQLLLEQDLTEDTLSGKPELVQKVANGDKTQLKSTKDKFAINQGFSVKLRTQVKPSERDKRDLWPPHLLDAPW